MTEHDSAPTDDEPELVWRDAPGFFGLYGAFHVLLAAGFFSIPLGTPFGVLAGATALWCVVRASWRRARLRITNEGIVDETFWYSSGLIPWRAIRDVRATRLGLIQVELFDESAFWDAQPPLKALALLKMQLFGFPPVLITPWGLEGTRCDLVARLQDGLDRWAVEAAKRGELAGPTLEADLG